MQQKNISNTTLRKLFTFIMTMLLTLSSGFSYEVFAEEEIDIETAVEEYIEENKQVTQEAEAIEITIEKEQAVVSEEAMLDVKTPQNTANEISSISSNEQSIRGFVVRLYRNVLGREADESGFNYWVKGIEDRSVTGAAAVKGFFLSDEMNKKRISNDDYIKLLYLTVLNRKADSVGLKYWTKKLDVKMSKESVINGFLNSKEFNNLCDNYGVEKGVVNATGYYRDINYDVTAFVDRMYSKTLERSSDITGLEYWTKNLINKKETGATLIKGFFLSTEFLNKNMSDEEFLKIAYRSILDRNPDKTGMRYWLGILENHYSRSIILKGFVESVEFKNLCRSYNITVGEFGKSDMFKTVNNVRISYLSQDDPRWKNIYYGKYTFGDSGCSETVLTMIFRAHGSNVAPTEIASYLYNNTKEYNGPIGAGTTGKGIKKAIDYFGYRLIPLKTKDELEDALRSGHTVYGSMGPGIFTNPGYTHAILFNGYSNGNTYAYDPKHPNKIGWHSISAIFSQKSRDIDDYYEETVFFMIFK